MRLDLCEECEESLLTQMKSQEVLENKMQVMINTDFEDRLTKLEDTVKRLKKGE